MRVFIFLAIIFFPVYAYAACPVINPQLMFKLNMVPVKYDYSLDKAQIRVKSNSSGLVSGHLQGNVNVEVKPKTRKSSDGKCILYSQADVVITNTPVIRVASNYKKGSCEYRVVKEHEEKHLSMMNDFFKTVERDYKPYLEKQFRGKGAVSVQNKEQLRQEILDIAKSFVDRINRDQSHIHQRDVDHPDKVADERAQCSGW